MNKIITANLIIRRYPNVIIYNSKVYNYDDFMLAVSLGYIKSKILSYKQTSFLGNISTISRNNTYDEIKENTYDEMKSLFLKSDITEHIIYYTLLQGFGKHRATVLFECLVSLYGNKHNHDDVEYYITPSLSTLDNISVTDLQVLGLQDIAKVLKHNLDLTYEFMLKSNIHLEKELETYVSRLRGISNVNKDLIRLYCFEDFNVFPLDERIRKILFKQFNLNIISYDRTMDFIKRRFPNIKLGEIYHLLIYNYGGDNSI